jgi:GAF domain-containing protein
MTQTALIEKVAEIAGSDGDLGTRASAITDLVRRETGYRWVGVYQVDSDVVRNLAWSGPAAPAHPIFAVGDGLTGSAIASRATVVSNDVASDPRYLTNQESTGSELIVPILAGNSVVGTLDVEHGETNAFGPAEQAVFEAVARSLTPLYT